MGENNQFDWREDPEVLAAQQRTLELERGCKAHAESIKGTFAEVREAESQRQAVENRFARSHASGLDLMQARREEHEARQRADEAQALAENDYQALAEAQRHQEEAEARAKAKAAAELRKAYLPAIDRLEEALQTAVEADAEVRQLYSLAESMFPNTSFPAGLASMKWRWWGLAEDSLAAWRAWRLETGLASSKAKAQALLAEVQKLALSVERT